MLKRRIIQTLLVVFVLSTLLMGAGAAYPADSITGITAGHTFSIPRWEMKRLLKIGPALDGGQGKEGVPESRPAAAVVEAFDNANGSVGKDASTSAGARKSTIVSSIIAQQVAQVLRDEGITLDYGPIRGAVFPPVDFELTDMPLLLVVSPREKIALMKTVLLDQSLSTEEIAKIESDVEKLGLSASVERIGGLSLYPSMVPADQSLISTLITVSHEWFHQYFFFTPLGRAYWSSYDMTTVNETAADIGGEEIGRMVYERYYSGYEADKRTTPGDAPTDSGPTFNFNEEMRTTRLKVDSLLAQGKVLEAESYMEARRRFLAGHGYYLRKLNQAYFAFHGAYADSPGSANPLGGQMLDLRRQSPSLAAFIAKITHVSNVDELKHLISQK